MRFQWLLPLTLVAAAGAADGFLDLRAGYSLVQKDYTDTVDNGVSKNDISDQWDTVHRGTVWLLWSPHGGWLIGPSFAVTVRDENPDKDNADLKYTGYALHGNLGYAFQFGPVFQLELVPFVGIGSSQLKRVTPGNVSTKDNATLIEYGANANAIFTLGSFQIGPQVGYLIEDTSHDIHGATQSNKYDFKKGNFLFSAVIGLRF